MKSTSSSHLFLTAAAALALFGCSSETPDNPGSGASVGNGGSASSSGAGGNDTTSSSGSGAGGEQEVAAHCESLQGEGDAEGQIAANWTLQDHLGNSVSLHDYCGKVLFFEEGSMW